MNLEGFDADEIPPADAFEPLPPGWYTGMIVESEEKSTKAGNGSYLQLVIEVTDGEFKGRKLWDRLNLNNQNSIAVEIAQRTLSAICLAVGVPAPKDSAELHFKPLAVRVKVRKYDGEDQNEVKGYRPIAANAATSTVSNAKPAPKEAPKKKAPPWSKSA